MRDDEYSDIAFRLKVQEMWEDNVRRNAKEEKSFYLSNPCDMTVRSAKRFVIGPPQTYLGEWPDSCIASYLRIWLEEFQDVPVIRDAILDWMKDNMPSTQDKGEK